MPIWNGATGGGGGLQRDASSSVAFSEVYAGTRGAWARKSPKPALALVYDAVEQIAAVQTIDQDLIAAAAVDIALGTPVDPAKCRTVLAGTRPQFMQPTGATGFANRSGGAAKPSYINGGASLRLDPSATRGSEVGTARAMLQLVPTLAVPGDPHYRWIVGRYDGSITGTNATTTVALGTTLTAEQRKRCVCRVLYNDANHTGRAAGPIAFLSDASTLTVWGTVPASASALGFTVEVECFEGWAWIVHHFYDPAVTNDTGTIALRDSPPISTALAAQGSASSVRTWSKAWIEYMSKGQNSVNTSAHWGYQYSPLVYPSGSPRGATLSSVSWEYHSAHDQTGQAIVGSVVECIEPSNLGVQVLRPAAPISWTGAGDNDQDISALGLTAANEAFCLMQEISNFSSTANNYQVGVQGRLSSAANLRVRRAIAIGGGSPAASFDWQVVRTEKYR